MFSQLLCEKPTTSFTGSTSVAYQVHMVMPSFNNKRQMWLIETGHGLDYLQSFKFLNWTWKEWRYDKRWYCVARRNSLWILDGQVRHAGEVITVRWGADERDKRVPILQVLKSIVLGDQESSFTTGFNTRTKESMELSWVSSSAYQW